MPSTGSPYHLGVGMAMAIAIIFISNYVWQVAADARQVSDALAATQMALEREQRISLLGGLAAAAAHQLGTPLGTITLIAKEMRREAPADSPMAEDLALLEQEVNRCRDILTELARRPEPDDEDPFRLMTLPALAGAAAETYLHAENRRLTITAPEGPPGEVLQLGRTPELIHGLGNLIQNALQFARNRVEISAEYGPKTVVLRIVDDGPGFPLALLNRLGEPYVSGRGEDSDHMGLGIFIAATLLEHSGAQLSFSNGPQGGAVIAVAWPRHKFERKERTWA
jgi:two-component system sensor histidine kinase RegB